MFIITNFIEWTVYVRMIAEHWESTIKLYCAVFQIVPVSNELKFSRLCQMSCFSLVDGFTTFVFSRADKIFMSAVLILTRLMATVVRIDSECLIVMSGYLVCSIEESYCGYNRNVGLWEYDIGAQPAVDYVFLSYEQLNGQETRVFSLENPVYKLLLTTLVTINYHVMRWKQK